MTLREAQTVVDLWIKEYGVRYFSELTNLALLVEETGELARIMARTYGDQSRKPAEKEADMADEMADILLCSFAWQIKPVLILKELLKTIWQKRHKGIN